MDAIVTDQQEIILTENPDIGEIYSELKSNMATLVLGPDLLTKDGLSARQALHQELSKTPSNGIIHFYKRNGIFLFDSPNSKFNCQKAAARYYESLEPNREMLEKIIDLPFSLILNTNPDKNLVKVFSEKKRKFQFGYFSRRPNKNSKDITEPSPENPLLYNLFGSVEEFQSLVLDFEDMFNHLTTLFNSTNVPDEIRTILKETYTFIFLGFHLEKWDTQLLFRYINMNEQEFDNRKKNYTRKTENFDSDSETFFTKQLNIKYYLAPIDFLNKIHSKYFDELEKEENDKLQSMQVNDAVRYLLEVNKFDKALTLIKSANENITETELAVVKGQYTRYINIRTAGTLSVEELNIQFNKLLYNIYELMSHETTKTPVPELAGMRPEDAICFFIGMDDIEGALNHLSKYVTDDLKVEYFTLKGQYANYTSIKKEGTIDFDALEILRNKVRQSIFSFCDKIAAP